MSIRSRQSPRNLDQRVTIQRPVETRDPSSGEVIIGWATVARPWARVDGQRGAERYVAGAPQGATPYNVTIRWRGDIQDNWRILWGSRILAIDSIPDQQRRGEKLVIFCTYGPSNA